MRATTPGVLGAIAGGELSQPGLREELPGELEGPVLFLVQVIAYLGRQLASELAEVIRRRVDAPQLFDELLSLVMIRKSVATHAETRVDHEERDIEVALLRRGVGVEFVGEGEKGSPAPLAGRSPVRQGARQRALYLVTGPQIIEDRHGARSQHRICSVTEDSLSLRALRVRPAGYI